MKKEIHMCVCVISLYVIYNINISVCKAFLYIMAEKMQVTLNVILEKEEGFCLLLLCKLGATIKDLKSSYHEISGHIIYA